MKREKKQSEVVITHLEKESQISITHGLRYHLSEKHQKHQGGGYRTRELPRELGKWAGNKARPPKSITFLEISLN